MGVFRGILPVRFGSKWLSFGLVLAGGTSLGASVAVAQEVNCANEFRSGKLYFSEKVYAKAVDRFALAVKTCPDKAEYRARYAIALAQLGQEKLAVVETTGDVAGHKADVDSVIAMYQLAGSEFDASLKTDNSKQNQKLVRENRMHFWVNRYNEGTKLAGENRNEAAALEFELSRMLDPNEIKAYQQGVVVLVNQGKVKEAQALIESGLAKAPNDSVLTSLQKRVGAVEAQRLLKQAEDSSTDPAKANELARRADSLLTHSIKDNPKNANLYFDRGLARMTRATTTKDSAQAAGIYGQAADDFEEARKLVPAATDSSFHQSALYNEIQSWMNANKIDESIELIMEYLSIDLDDASVWKFYAQALLLSGDKKTGAIALIISNSMTTGSPVTIEDAVKNAGEDQKKALTDRGQPSLVYAYTADMAGKIVSVECWLWHAKKKASVYYLGKDNGEVRW